MAYRADGFACTAGVVLSRRGSGGAESRDKANNETYQSQKASAVIRPSAKVTAKRDGADSNYTANYMTWDMYTKYAEAVQKNNLTFEYTLATSVPVRASKSLQAIAAKSDTSEDKTGGNLTLQAFYTNDAAKSTTTARSKWSRASS